MDAQAVGKYDVFGWRAVSHVIGVLLLPCDLATMFHGII